jgi:Ca2+-binding RTX toxin-like protein
VGGNGNDRLTGGAGNDVLQGNRGRDLLSGGNGDDKLYFSDDASWSLFATRRNNGSPGHSGTSDTISIAGKRQSQDILDGGAGNDTLIGTGRSDAILLDDTSSPAQGSGPRIVGIERIEAGAGNDVVDLTSRRYAYGNVTIDGGSGNDVLWSSSGNDVLLGDSGNDRMDGGAGNDYLNGGTGRDAVDGGEGVDALQGGSGRDELRDTSGNGLLDGGSGDDRLTGGSNNVLFIGGKGDDTVRLGSGSNVVAFDRGDGRDVIQSESGGTSTLSLGAGIRLQDLAFRRSGDNLILETGNNESITFDNWYRSRSNQRLPSCSS